MTAEDLKRLLDDICKARIAVLGDYCLDAYWFVDRSREEISVETGLPTRPVMEQRYSLGGAGNVVMNLVAMGVDMVLAGGVVGPDPFGNEMLRLLKLAGVAWDGILTQAADWATHVYAKPYVNDTEESRIDFGTHNILSAKTCAELLEWLRSAVRKADVVVVNEQISSGIHSSADFREGLCQVVRDAPDVIFVLDSRHYADSYSGMIRKINAAEAMRLCGKSAAETDVVSLDDAVAAARALEARWGLPVAVTRGARGCVVADRAKVEAVPGILIHGRTDPVGAGDSFLAGLAAALAAGRDVFDGARLGNFAAAVTVQKLFQTGVATPEEIMEVGADPDYVYRPELAEDARKARMIEGTDIEIVGELPSGERFTDVVFDHDGTISTLRQGWENIMEPFMVRAILGEKYGTVEETLYLKVLGRVRDFVEKTTGMQTLAQMHGLVGMVAEFGLVPGSEVLDANGYKRLYNEELMRVVKDRIRRLRSGRLSVEDFTIKNACVFLRRLRGMGLRLYLASGTDEEDVRAEAEALGYADVFEGRIYGAVGRVEVDVKKIVMDRIISDSLKMSVGRLLTFGDGPVEIRETRKHGGYCVGVASDEIRRFGLNSEKRARLIKAGADLIIPDYSDIEKILDALGLA